jgi:hypothetical protein
MMIVLGEQPVQVALLGLGAGDQGAPAVAVGAKNRAGGDVGVRFRPWSSGLTIRAASVFSRTWLLCRIEAQVEENRSAVQIACGTAW